VTDVRLHARPRVGHRLDRRRGRRPRDGVQLGAGQVRDASAVALAALVRDAGR
jgi:hypothetical protein